MASGDRDAGIRQRETRVEAGVRTMLVTGMVLGLGLGLGTEVEMVVLERAGEWGREGGKSGETKHSLAAGDGFTDCHETPAWVAQGAGTLPGTALQLQDSQGRAGSFWDTKEPSSVSRE